jgi:hypothetical protein
MVIQFTGNRKSTSKTIKHFLLAMRTSQSNIIVSYAWTGWKSYTSALSGNSLLTHAVTVLYLISIPFIRRCAIDVGGDLQ